MLELHREHLSHLTAEAWSDGVLTESEIADLNTAASHLNLTEVDVAAALQSRTESRAVSSESLIAPGDRIVFTGALRRPREEWISDICAAGLVTGAVTKSTKLVVAADPDSLSGKAEKARSYGVPVINEKAFEKYFDEYLKAAQPLAI